MGTNELKLNKIVKIYFNDISCLPLTYLCNVGPCPVMSTRCKKDFLQLP